MTKKKSGLGRGLEQLLGDTPTSTASTAPPAATDAGRALPIERIRVSRHQPRQRFDDERLAALAESIRRDGMMQPVVVRRVDDGYELIAGERRWRAAQRAGLVNVPAIVREADERQAAALALVENLQREALNPMEQADGARRLAEEFGAGHAEIGEIIGMSRSAVSNLLRLHKLTDEVQTMVRAGELEMGHARALASLPRERQLAAARRARRLSVRQTEELAARLSADKKPRRKSPENADVRLLERELADALGAKVRIRHAASGKGRVEIHYHGLEALEGVLRRLRA